LIRFNKFGRARKRHTRMEHSFETTPRPPMPQACPNVARPAFHPDYAAIGTFNVIGNFLHWVWRWPKDNA
jgi:hypothetical protein